MSPASVEAIISETWKVIWDVLISKGYLDYPKPEPDWLKVAQEHDDCWNFPNALAAIEENAAIKTPASSGSVF